MHRETEAPFIAIPGAIDIAHWFIEEHIRDWYQLQGADGFELYRDGNDYCYLWVEVFVDNDLATYWLLDIRTATRENNPWESRDYLFVGTRPFITDKLDVEWHQNPIQFNEPYQNHRIRFRKGMEWFVDRIESSREDDEQRSKNG